MKYLEPLATLIIAITIALAVSVFFCEVVCASELIKTKDGYVTEDSLWGKNGTYKRKNYDLKVVYEQIKTKGENNVKTRQNKNR